MSGIATSNQRPLFTPKTPEHLLDMTRKRDLNGKFLGHSPPTEQYLRIKRIRKERNERNLAIGSRLFDSYLDVTFLEGQEKDWIMADAQNGPLAGVPIRLFKSAFLPSCKDRCEKVRRRYFSYAQNTKQSDIKQEYIIDGFKPGGKQKRRRIFKKRRLARLGSDDEMARVWNWIDEGLQVKAFKVFTREEAYDVIREAFYTYKRHNTEMYYECYPPVSQDESTQCDESNSSERQTHRPATGSGGASSTDRPESRIVDESNGSDVTRKVQTIPPQPTSLEAVLGGNAVDRAHTSTVCHLLKAAVHDRLFFLLCKVDEDMRECKLDCVATALLEMHENGDLKCNAMLRDALHYGRLRQSGVKDLRAYHVHKHRVHMNAEMVKLVRRSYTNLRPYEQMRWTDFSQNSPNVS